MGNIYKVYKLSTQVDINVNKMMRATVGTGFVLLSGKCNGSYRFGRIRKDADILLLDKKIRMLDKSVAHDNLFLNQE